MQQATPPAHCSHDQDLVVVVWLIHVCGLNVRFPVMFLTIDIVGADGHAYASYCELSCLSSHIHIGVCKFSLAAIEHEN